MDEQTQDEPRFENEIDEDDHLYKESEAIPPAPKLQGTIPRTNSNTNNSIHVSNIKNNDILADATAVENQKSIDNDGKLSMKLFSV